jgi:hypothetical protein
MTVDVEETTVANLVGLSDGLNASAVPRFAACGGLAEAGWHGVLVVQVDIGIQCGPLPARVR